ncbi:hypothetical protein SDC9_123240 [bioreactor metagenome]|uniref:Uncharacterized protein n=1 Tax=bioreactor metagenome TaxID=1076179 RepID=A0A645CH29_9ZZZZ
MMNYILIYTLSLEKLDYIFFEGNLIIRRYQAYLLNTLLLENVFL